MKRKTIFLVTALLGLILSFGLVGTGWAAEAGDSLYDWGPWGKVVTPAAGPGAPPFAVGGAAGFEYKPLQPQPAAPVVAPSGPPAGPGLPNVPGVPPAGPGMPNAPGGGPPGVPGLPGAPQPR